MVMENKLGQTEQNTKEIGEMEWLRARVHFTTLTVMSIPESSIKIEPTDLVPTFTRMGRSMKGTGRTICKMERVKNYSRMGVNTREPSSRGRSGGWELTCGQMARSIPEIGKTTALRDEESMYGQIKESMKVTGRIISYMEMESTPGLMAGDTKASTSTIRKKATEFTPGLTGRNTMASGKTESSMEKQSSQIQKENPRSDSGRTGRGYAG